MEEEAARDLVRAREDTLQDRLRARHRLGNFLLRQGRVDQESKSWGIAHRVWIKSQKFQMPAMQQSFEAYLRSCDESEARLKFLDQQVLDLAQSEPYRTAVSYLRCFKGVDTLSAITLIVETQDFQRFSDAPAFMKFTGLTSSEWSSAEKVRRGAITKAGNAHLRRVLVEAAWSYRRHNITGEPLLKRREGCPSEVVELARKTQDRLHRRFYRLNSKGKSLPVTVTAVARELAGFVWSMARHFPKIKTT